MANTSPIALPQLFRYWRALPHQSAAVVELEADLAANGYSVAMRRDRPWFATWSQDGKQAEIKAGLPLAMGFYHKGPVGAPSGGGHWLACFGFDPFGWTVNDPQGELDLITGRWLRTGGNSGRALRYSYKNFNPRWQTEGAGSGWTWLFS
jgi:hypothetical protein